MLGSILNNQQEILGGTPQVPATGRRIGRGFFRSAALWLLAWIGGG